MNKNVFYTTKAICTSHNLTDDAIEEMVYWGIAEPVGRVPGRWLFSQADYVRIGCATRLKRELDINIPGAALALDLLEELDKIRREVRSC